MITGFIAPLNDGCIMKNQDCLFARARVCVVQSVSVSMSNLNGVNADKRKTQEQYMIVQYGRQKATQKKCWVFSPDKMSCR